MYGTTIYCAAPTPYHESPWTSNNELAIVCFPVILQNNPLYIRTAEPDRNLRLQHAVYSSLDVIDEKSMSCIVVHHCYTPRSPYGVPCMFHRDVEVSVPFDRREGRGLTGVVCNV